MINEGPFDVVLEVIGRDTSFTVRLPHGWYRVGALKRKIQERLGDDIRGQYLEFGGTKLKNDKYLWEYGVGVGEEAYHLKYAWADEDGPFPKTSEARRPVSIGPLLPPGILWVNRMPGEINDVDFWHIKLVNVTRPLWDADILVDPQWTWVEFIYGKAIPYYKQWFNEVKVHELFHYGPSEWPSVEVDREAPIGDTQLRNGVVTVFGWLSLKNSQPRVKRKSEDLDADELPTGET